ncbi:mycofactocin system GMC family oxidoreductase MftG [Gordonia jinghuaiqii]|uniref:Mycofactocin system GMC family oxidoreductase MftG n=1 Tax=Gordonia jinghuaiqii TaxID=2758710 RepID=A0A7D7LSY7_9ACTN|nr:mycofactocin system GMC family oxidoreductase MftG [Gordonia jinghuaiqii]MCR5979456.1 mycofactocin system GMC family oxidoreductase MftG [Gordonia jinghuaiqii]MCR5979878.1 mycofactocin system GMC family oxidoreductase MftG [Gordonia jinghuaiqii]QMT00741.1 mycofactocin system GMC family oxidoreductase MftG [Gordonia jinghuaiqii]
MTAGASPSGAVTTAGLPRADLGTDALTADVVIVGAGSAGCVLAEKLSRDPGRQVVLIERGPSGMPSLADLDLRRLPIDDAAPFAVRHATDLGPAAARGSALGGSSAVNGGYFLRWHPGDFAAWPSGWEIDVVAAAYDELDGPYGTMGVEPVSDDELGDTGTAFEHYWSTRVPVRPVDERWPVVGLNRVLSNRTGMSRRTSAAAYLVPAAARRNLLVVTDCEVEGLEVARGRTVTGVRAGPLSVTAGEVILSAGTLGTARILLRSGLDVLGLRAAGGEFGAGEFEAGEFEAGEHRALAVSYRRRGPAAPGMVLPTVLHTDDDCEIRCYRDDFASHIRGVPAHGPIVEVACMRPSPVRIVDDGPVVRLAFGEPDGRAAAAMRDGAAHVVEMLQAPEFADIVVPGSVSVAPAAGFSQHAWGTMPMGVRTDWLGGVYGTHGLRIVDASILPGGGHSGPHATVMMVACRIGELLAAR